MNLKLMRLLAILIFTGLLAFGGGDRSALWPAILGIITISVLDFLPMNEARRKAVTLLMAGVAVLVTMSVVGYNLRDHDFAGTWQYWQENWLLGVVIIYLPVFILSCVGYAFLKRRKAK